MNKPFIHTISTAVPPHRISQSCHCSILESANGMSRKETLVLKKVYSHSGIEYRHSVLEEFAHEDAPGNIIFHPSGNYPPTPVSKRMEVYEQYAAGLCAEAVEKCFASLPALQKEAVTHLITFSCTGMYAPGLDIQLVEKIGLKRNVERTCINFMGCYAAINALKSAYYIACAEPGAVVLIAGVELCSLHYVKSYEPEQTVANALFADGAAAAIISAKQPAENTEQPAFRLCDFYSEFEQSASNDMIWRIGDLGFDLRLTPEVPGIVRGSIKALVEKLLSKAGLEQKDIDYYAIHPGGVKILEACEDALGIAKEMNQHSYEVLRNYGNMSSVTVLFVLERYLAALNNSGKGKKMIACAFGPGITMESMIVETC